MTDRERESFSACKIPMYVYIYLNKKSMNHFKYTVKYRKSSPNILLT